MKILFVTDQYAQGGLETHLATYFEFLKNSGHKVYFASKLLDPRSYETGCRPHIETFFSLNETGFAPENVLPIADELRNIARTEKIDLIHAHPFLSYYAAYLTAVTENLPMVMT
ncbi:MAG: glycosyltransferase family 4 protein, partial [Myxococcota bacterium]